MQISYDDRNWNRLIIHYSHTGETDRCSFMLNEETKFFVRNKEKKIDYDIFLGGHPKEKEPSNVYLSNFEIYSNMAYLK